MIQWMQWTMLLLPWSTLLLAKKDARRRYLPVVLLSVLLLTIFFVMGYSNRWWTIHEYILAPFGRIVDVSFVYGIFPVGTFWIFYFTSRKLWIYLAVNAAINLSFSLGILPLMDRIGIVTFQKLPAWSGFPIDMALAFILYGYFKWQDRSFRASDPGGGGNAHYRTQKPRFLEKRVQHDDQSRARQ